MTKIMVEIDCGKETCGECHNHYYPDYHDGELCVIFHKDLDIKHCNNYPGRNFDWLRLPECIAAEVKEC